MTLKKGRNDMAEYIDREKLLELINEDCKYQNPTNEYTRGCNEVCDWAIKTIKNIPTADVVPKSEVERLKVEGGILEQECGKLQATVASLEIELDSMRSAANSYKMHYESLAMEIFEEIERTCVILLAIFTLEQLTENLPKSKRNTGG